MTVAKTEQDTAAFRIIAEQLDEGIRAAKCHQCGCLQQTVEALTTTAAGQDAALAGKLTEARDLQTEAL